jgi:hypothetical protein
MKNDSQSIGSSAPAGWIEKPKVLPIHESQEEFVKYLADRGLTFEQAVTNGLTLTSNTSEQALTIATVRKHYCDTGKTIPGMLISYGDGLYTFRYLCDEEDYPTDANSGKKVKLANPSGKGGLLFFPPCIDWANLPAGIKVHICESALKAVTMAVRGRAAIGLNGVRGWSSGKRIVAKLVESFRDRGWIPVITFDANAHDGPAFNPEVASAQSALVAALYGACSVEQVFIVKVPCEHDLYDQGIDDYFGGGGTLAELDALTYEVDADGTPTLSGHNLEDFLDVEFIQPTAIVSGFISTGECNLLTSAPKAGKTRIALTAALQIASGKGPMLGIPGLTCHRSKVLLIIMEDADFNLKQTLKEFMDYLGLTLDDIRGQLKLVTKLDKGLDLIVKLDRECKDFKPDLVIVDNITSLGIIESKPEPIGNLIQREYAKLKRFSTWSQTKGVALLLLAHSKKGAASQGNIADKTNSTGTQAGAVDNLASLDRPDKSKNLGETHRRFMTQARYHKAIDVVVTVDAEPVTFAGDWWAYDLSDVLASIAVTVRELVREGKPQPGEEHVWVSTQDIAKRRGANINTIRNQCQTLVAKGWLEPKLGREGGYTLTSRATEALDGVFAGKGV